jgi:hypothetical protein
MTHNDYAMSNYKEIHAGKVQQKKMALYLREILGDRLVREKVENREKNRENPSPDELKYKFIIKAKIIEKKINLESKHRGNSEFEKDLKTMNAAIEHANESIAKEISELVVYARATKLKNFKFSQIYSTYDRCASIDNVKCLKFAKKSGNEFIWHTNLQLIRIYPNWKNQLSENYNPLDGWAHGAQIVALNYQTVSEPMFLNLALFELNGNCGYILKPEYLRTGNKNSLKSTQTGSKVNSKKIRVKIYSASNLPTEKFEVVDPYVLVSVVTPSSQKKKEHLAIYRIIP